MSFETFEKNIRMRIFTIVILVCVTFVSMLIAISIGSVDIPLAEVISILLHLDNINSTNYIILYKIRIPRVIIAGLAGGALAVAGCITQSVFRNSLASPYVLGIASGAAFGASLAVILELWRIVPLPFFAFIFAIIALIIDYIISWDTGISDSQSLLLTGLAVSSFFSALTSFMMYLAGEKLEIIVFWLMGGLAGLSWRECSIIAIAVLPLIFASLMLSQDLNIILFGEEMAISLGVDVKRTNILALLLVALLVAICVSYVGPIGFVGLMIPHMTRMLVGSDNRFLIPASAFLGASFLIVTDLLSRTIIRPAEIPIGIITSLFGVPFFIYLLKKRSKMVRYYAS